MLAFKKSPSTNSLLYELQLDTANSSDTGNTENLKYLDSYLETEVNAIGCINVIPG